MGLTCQSQSGRVSNITNITVMTMMIEMWSIVSWPRKLDSGIPEAGSVSLTACCRIQESKNRPRWAVEV